MRKRVRKEGAAAAVSECIPVVTEGDVGCCGMAP